MELERLSTVLCTGIPLNGNRAAPAVCELTYPLPYDRVMAQYTLMETS